MLRILPDYCDEVPYQIKGMAVKDACDALTTNKKKRKQTGQPFKLHFRSRKAPKQSIFIPASAISSNGVYHTLLGNLKMSEMLPVNPKDSRLSFQQGRWYLCVPSEQKLLASENQGRVVAIDPGVRTFSTFFAEKSMGKLGSGDFSRIARLCFHLDKLLSKRDLLKNKNKKRSLTSAIDRVRWKIRDLISELHFKTARFYVDNFDIILLPTFEVSNMTLKSKRKLKKKSVKSMLSLAHYRFSQILEQKAFEAGKRVVRVSEAYTSKTNSWTGEIKNVSKFYKMGNIEIDRDINGARGILLRALRDTSLDKNRCY